MHLRKIITAGAFLLLAGCSQQKIDPKSTQESIIKEQRSAQEKIITDKQKAKQCDFYEKTINELTKIIDKAQFGEAMITIEGKNSADFATMISQRLTFAAVTQSNYLQLGAIRGCKFTNLNLPQKIVDS